MELKNLRVEYRYNPVGLDTQKPRFSWQMISNEKNVIQTAYRIRVSDEAGNVAWDTGRLESDSSVLVEYEGAALEPCTGYGVYVEAWDNKGNHAWCEGFFETGLFGGTNFGASWISHNFPPEETACPVFFKEFKLEDKPVKRARIYATALGVYEIKLNNRKVGDAFFAPGWTNYKKRLQYQTYVICREMLGKDNKIEITVGNGWYKGIFGFMCTPNIYGDRVAALAEIHITYADGTKQVIKTDESWKVTTGSIRYSEIYMGETIDSRFKEDKEYPVVITDFDKECIVAQENEPVRITERIPAREFIITPKGERVLDFGQNLTGFVEVRIKGRPGQKITIRHAETLDKDGNFYTENLRQAKATDVYICNGEDQIFMPHFTFHGFRYISVEGLDDKDIKLENFTACVLHTDMEPTGTFICSDPLVNRLQMNIQWSQRDNFLDIPTDCPQRDERLGWTGDAQVFSWTAAYNYNVALFFTKWLHDLASEQTARFGVPHVVPNILGDQDGAAGWSDAATIVPWMLYQTYGDVRILQEQYESMKGWVDYITAHCGDNGLWQTGFQYGDWLALDKEEGMSGRTGATDPYLIANAFYANSIDIVRRSARILGKTDDAQRYDELYSRVKKAFNEEYVTATGRLVSETQTACVLALHFNLVDERHRQRIIKTLEANIEGHRNHLTTGFLGTPYLLHVLSENGLHELAGTIFLKEDYPSWLYAVKKGATTIWERWNSILPNGDFESSGMNSLNHYAYGSVGDWMYRKLAGINQLEPGYKKILIKPQFVKGITWVKASFNSPYGLIRSEWSCIDKRITVEVEIPANTTAILYLPEKDEPIEIGSGRYHYEYDTETSLERERFSLESTLEEILNEPLAVQMLNELVPGMLDNPMLKAEVVYKFQICELLNYAPEIRPVFESIIHALNQNRIK